MTISARRSSGVPAFPTSTRSDGKADPDWGIVIGADSRSAV